MAVYTRVSSEQIADFLTRFDAGTLVAAKGIAEGVENSNYLIDTTEARFILTLYEKRVDPADLPFFVALLDHLKRAGCPVPAMIGDRGGKQVHKLAGRPACLIEYLPGVSASDPTSAQARATGAALGELHLAVRDFPESRPNELGPDGWRALADQCGDGQLDGIDSELHAVVTSELEWLAERWPAPDALPRSVVHADLFPDNVLMLGERVSGLIDFYFSCEDFRAYDVAVTHAAWCFSDDGSAFSPSVSNALLDGYQGANPLGEREREALHLFARGAALRFTLTRAYDLINTPADALVMRKDPMPFARRLAFYRANERLFDR